MCPSGAIVASPFTIRLDRCILQRMCEAFSPGDSLYLRLPFGYQRSGQVVRSGRGSPQRITLDENRVEEIRRHFGRSLRLREVSAGGDNSTEMELNATMNVNFDLPVTVSSSPLRRAMPTAS